MTPNEVQVDTLSVFYKHIDMLPYWMKGMEMNRKHIENCLVVCDGKFTEEELSAFFAAWPGSISIGTDDMQPAVEEGWPTLRLLELDDKPEGSFRASRALNLGFEMATSDYVHTVSFHAVLQPDSIEVEKQFAAPRKVLVGAMHHINPEDVTLASFPDNVPIAVPDWKPALHGVMDRAGRQWLYCHNSQNLWHRESVLKIGGFNTEAELFGRTEEDHEFGARWLLHYGSRAIFFGPTHCWSLDDRGAQALDLRNETKRPTIQAREVLARTLGNLYDQQYYLFADVENQPLYSHVQVLPTEVFRQCDVRVSCTDLSWMEEGAAKDIVAIVGHQYAPGDIVEQMVGGMYRALKPWGRIRLMFPADPVPGSERTVWEAAVEQAGFEIEQLPDGILLACKVEDDG
jgi:SAM-dependent methyltransferase